MSAPFKRFRVFRNFLTNIDRFLVEVTPYVNSNESEAEFDLEQQRKFIEDAIREKLEREP